MYSVLIQNQKTMDCFHQHHSLFLEVLNNNDIGVCRWMEAGTTVDTAVPELRSLTDDKEEWRAIIVRVEDESSMSEFPSDPLNPYDFAVKASCGDGVGENPVPLVRLTQILGGVPAPEIRFECEVLAEENKAERMIYKPVMLADKQEEHRKLSQKYSYDGKMPTEIILVSLRLRIHDPEENTRNIWGGKSGAWRSEFWRRNHYPSACRFTFLSMDRKGPVQRTADLFRLWACVLLLSTNSIDSSALQAYKLYELDVDVNDDAMRKAMQQVVNRLVGAQFCMEKSEQMALCSRDDAERKLPDYRVKVPVVLNLPRRDDFYAKAGSFGIAPHAVKEDVHQWAGMCSAAEQGLRAAVRTVERALDQSAERARRYCSYSESEVPKLDAYQEEDMESDLDALSRTVLSFQAEMPQGLRSYEAALEHMGRHIRDALLTRANIAQSLAGIVIATILMLLCVIPAGVLCWKRGYGSYGGTLAAFAGGLLSLGLTELLILLGQRARVRQEIRAYNHSLGAFLTKLFENSSAYSRFLSAVASLTHGRSFLKFMRRPRFHADPAAHLRESHHKAINEFMHKLREWSMAFRLTVNFESEGIEDDFCADTDAVAPRANKLYTFEYGMSYRVPLNNTGDYVDSPIGFIQKMKLVREELYDDKNCGV